MELKNLVKCLKNVTPTPEQLKIIGVNRLGAEVIRGAAGSGKTTTAILRLKALIGMNIRRRQQENSTKPINILVLTFNRTLKAYIEELTQAQIDDPRINLVISNFAQWQLNMYTGHYHTTPTIVDQKALGYFIQSTVHNIQLPSDFIENEVDYILGRFDPEKIDEYLVASRIGRGTKPRVSKEMRVQILDNIVFPFLKDLADKDIHEWNELTKYKIPNRQYDAIVCDETQDFTANQLRTINSHLSNESSLTIVVDTAQRIYARGYTWLETGIVVRPGRSHRLTINYRNSKEIAMLAASLLHNIPVDDDFTVPSLEKTISSGYLPDIVEASYSSQVEFTLKHIDNNVDLENETVAFLHPKGGNWFKYLRSCLTQHGLAHINLTRMYEWPQGDESIGLCTLHSAKGLEFDHVFVLGLNNECLSDWEDADDHRYITTRKLLGMGVGRAKKSVIIGYKPEAKSEIIDLIDPTLYNLVKI